MSEEGAPLTPEQAREIAHNIAGVLMAPLSGWAQSMPEGAMSLADVIRLGATFAATINQSYQDAILRENNGVFLAKVLESLHTQNALEDFLFERLMANGVSEALEIDLAMSEIREFLATPDVGKRMLKEALSEVIPKAAPGRPTRFRYEADREQFLKTVNGLFPVCQSFVSLHDQFPSKSPSELLDFLQTEAPDKVAELRERVQLLASYLLESEVREAKSVQTRARRLAEGLVGAARFNWSFKYSLQRAGEFRRTRSESEFEGNS
jgi:hypothetical protein